MAKLPEAYAEERARQAMEKAARLEKAREARAKKKLENLPDEDQIKQQVKEQLTREEKLTQAKVKEPELELLNKAGIVKTGIQYL